MTTKTEAWAAASPAVRARSRWELLARPEQLTPPGDWNVWLFMAGRGAGKTRAAAEDMAYYGFVNPGARMAIVAPTYADARDTCVEGESGLLSILPKEEIRLWNRSMGELVLVNGARYKLFSADEPERLRGPQHERVWADELGAFTHDETWDMLTFGLRLGEHPQAVVTTTPRPTPVIKRLLKRDDTTVTRGTTYDNAANLAPVFLESVRRRYEGTRIGRQELLGEMLEDVEGALWKREWFEREGFRVAEPPTWWQRAPVIGVDPADGTQTGDEQAYTVAGLGPDHLLYVIESKGLRVTVYAFARTVIDRALHYAAIIVLERNAGQGWLVEVFEQAMRDMGVHVGMRVVSATQGKRTRAEPVAALYERDRVRHVGRHVELEEQQASFTGAPNEKSPDLLDSAVWALSTFTTMAFGPQNDEPVASYTERITDPAVVAWS